MSEKTRTNLESNYPTNYESPSKGSDFIKISNC